jgi:hypothetical protein
MTTPDGRRRVPPPDLALPSLYANAGVSINCRRNVRDRVPHRVRLGLGRHEGREEWQEAQAQQWQQEQGQKQAGQALHERRRRGHGRAGLSSLLEYVSRLSNCNWYVANNRSPSRRSLRTRRPRATMEKEAEAMPTRMMTTMTRKRERTATSTRTTASWWMTRMMKDLTTGRRVSLATVTS